MEFQFICLWQPWYVSLLSLLANVAGGSVLLYCGIQWVVSRRVGRLDFGRRDAAWLIGLTLLAVTSSSVSLAWLSNFDVGHLPGLFTDRLFRGYAIGGAQVSEKHSGFVINKGGATAADILNLIAAIQAAVKTQFGVDLKTEVIVIGND